MMKYYNTYNTYTNLNESIVNLFESDIEKYSEIF